MGGKAGKTKAKPRGLGGLAAVQATGLFADIDVSEMGELSGRGEQLAQLVEAHLRGANDELVLSSPQSPGDMLALGIEGIAAVLVADPDDRYVHLVEGGQRTTYQ